MKTKVIGKTTRITFTYLEWVGMKGVLPVPTTMLIDGKTEYVITEVPEDKQNYFEELGFKVRLAVNKGKGMKKW
jgi:hypothetical protein